MKNLEKILFATLAIFASTAMAEKEDVWFDRLAPAKAVSGKALEHAAKTVFAAARGRSVSSDDFQALKTGSGPRMAFVSASNGKERAWTVYASGDDFPEAVARAVNRLKKVLPNEFQAHWVTLDLVQDVALTPNFHMQKSKASGPGFRGIAFSPTAPFAFLPGQLLFNSMYLIDGRLNVGRLGELLLNRTGLNVLGSFKQILLYDGPQPLFTFDTQSVFTDGTVMRPLYRGHRFYGPVARHELERSARDLALFLLRNCNSRGRFPVEPAPWAPDIEGTHSAAARAYTAWALAGYAKSIQNKPSRAAAIRILDDLVKNDVKSVIKTGDIVAVLEFVRADLKTNALTILALLELTSEDEAGKVRKNIAVRLGQFILYQMQPDGSLLTNRFPPNGDFNVEFSVDDSASAIVALTRLYDVTENPVWLNAAKRAMHWILKNELAGKSMAELPDSPWLLSALNSLYTYERDDILSRQAQRLLLSITSLQKTSTMMYADLVGSYDRRPTTSSVALLTPHLAAAALLLDEAGFGSAAKDVLRSLHLNLVFQLQAQHRPESVMNMPDPGFIGAFRDDIRTNTVSLAAQALQLRSLVAVLELMKDQGLETLPIDRERLDFLKRARALIYRFGE